MAAMATPKMSATTAVIISKRLSSSAAAPQAAAVLGTNAHAAAEARKSHAPPSVLSIPSTVRHGPTSLRTPQTPPSLDTAGAAIRQVGCTRRVFLLRPHLTPSEINGLAYRIATLGKNVGINSVLIATSDDDDAANLALPTTCVESIRTGRAGGPNAALSYADYGEKTGFGQVFHVAGGYDPRVVHAEKLYDRPDELAALMDGIRALSSATRGAAVEFPLLGEEDKTNNSKGGKSRVPIITMPHGLVNDSGYALCMSTYVLATRDTCYRILNPSRGLAFDPVGLSYVLPRLGMEYGQPSRDYPCGAILALTGYEADHSDMMETGLATHYVEAPSKLGALERSLGEIQPWRQQGLVKPPPRRYGQITPGTLIPDDQPGDEHDNVNAAFHNVAVANLVHSVSVYDAEGQELANPNDERAFLFGKDGSGDDPSVNYERESFYGDRSSTLVDIAATFADIFEPGNSLEDIMDGLREVVATGEEKGVDDEEEREGVDVAATLLEDMERKSPLALRAVHRLLELGGTRNRNETVESCMERERVVQMNLFRGEDYRRWAESGADEGEFRDWKHGSVGDVTNDEVEELFREKA